jgi:eukaryotic-like serine/threonine-protein kinase
VGYNNPMHAGADSAKPDRTDATATGERAPPLTGIDDHFGFAPPGAAWPGSRAFPPGSSVGGATIIRLIAEGGMGRVYEARQRAPDRVVALKVLKEGLASPELARRFAHEADLLGRLRHPAIAQVHAAGTHAAVGADWPFMLMELVAEATTITAHARARGLSARDRVALFARACAGVAHANQEGIVHRDLKPGNILVDGAGDPKVIDFGVARSLRPDAERLTSAAQQGELIGTIRYMSPEQLGIDAAEVDARSDVYALGLVLHELLLGNLPYELRGRSVMEAACVLAAASGLATGPLTQRLRGAGLAAAESAALAAVIATCLEPAPGDRYGSAVELERDLRRWLAGDPVAARPLPLKESLARLARRHRTAALAAAAVAVALVVAVVGITAFWVRAERQRQAADQARDLAERRRGEAEASTREARQQLYLSTVLLAAEARDRDNIREARRLLAEAESLATDEARPVELDCLAASLDESRGVLPDLGAQVMSAAWSPDGTRIALGTAAGRLLTWQPGASGDPVATGPGLNPKLAPELAPELDLTPHDETIWDVAFSPNGRRLASASADGVVAVHDLESAALVGSITGHASAVYGVDFSPDGALVATASRDRTIRLWDAETLEEAAVLHGHEGTVFSVRFSPQGDRLVSASKDGTVRVWSVADHRAEQVITATTDGTKIFRAVFSPDASLIAAAGEDGLAQVWRADGTRVQRLRHPQRVNAVGFLAAGSVLATASGDGLLRTWDVATGHETARRRGHADDIMSLAIHPGSTAVATGSKDASARVWNTSDDDEPLLRFADEVRALTISGDGAWLAAGDATGTVRVVDAATLGERATLATPAGRINALAFAPDARHLVAARDDGSVARFDLATGRSLERFPVHTRRVYDVAFSRDGRTLATGSEDRTARLVAADDGRERLPPLRHPGRVFATAFHPDGRLLATACGDRIVRLWSLADGAELAAWPGHAAAVNWVTFTPAGDRLASASSDGTVRIWDVDTGRTTAVLTGPARQVWRVAFSRDGSRVAATVADGTVQIWDVASGQPVAVLRGHSDEAWGLAFRPDGHALATSSLDGSVRLWGVSVAALARARHSAR